MTCPACRWDLDVERAAIVAESDTDLCALAAQPCPYAHDCVDGLPDGHEVDQ